MGNHRRMDHVRQMGPPSRALSLPCMAARQSLPYGSSRSMSCSTALPGRLLSISKIWTGQCWDSCNIAWCSEVGSSSPAYRMSAAGPWISPSGRGVGFQCSLCLRRVGISLVHGQSKVKTDWGVTSAVKDE